MTAGLYTQQISRVGTSSLSPAALCQWGMLTLIDGAAECQDWPRLACAVFVTGLVIVPGWRTVCDAHHVTHRVPRYACELKEYGFFFFIIILDKTAALIFDGMCPHVLIKPEHKWV